MRATLILLGLLAVPASYSAARTPHFRVANCAGQGITEGGQRDLKIVSLKWKVRRADSNLPFVAWRAVIENETSQRLNFVGRIQFLDADKRVVQSYALDGFVSADRRKNFKGEALVSYHEAHEIVHAKARMVVYPSSNHLKIY
jgi:hypothetical protein